jgi:alpha-N-acetylglucosaminidase
MGDFYLPRWQKWLDELQDALASGLEPEALDWFSIEEPWTRRRKDYPLRPYGDAYRTAARVRDVLARAPYQGTVTVTAEPSTIPPGGQARLAATFRNVNGLRATGRVDFMLMGIDAAPENGTSLPRVAAAGQGTVSWQARTPAAPLDMPLRPLSYTIDVRYGPRGEKRVTHQHRGTLFEAGPLAGGWRTYSNNEAVFGQLADRFAIDGGGSDLWKATTEFGAVYREGVFRDGSSVLLRVDAQAVTGAWARAGIVVRNSLGTPGSLGFVNLSVTPSNGVVLSYDTNADGTLDTYRRITGIKAPVLLRLSRADGAYTGACSTDGGATWRTVAAVPVPGAAAAQDVGLFMTATNGGSGVRGTVEFSGWALT